jgi:hypothetical protein
MTWWVKNIHNQYRVLNRNNPQVVLQTDASLLGWGAVMNDSKTGGRWNYDETIIFFCINQKTQEL